MQIFVAASALHINKSSNGEFESLLTIPAAARRRLSPFAKNFLAAVCDVFEAVPLARKVPVVLSSRHGDLQRTIHLLNDLVAGEQLSPTKFCLSVNNAVLGQLSMIDENRSAMTTIGAGANSFGSAWLEGYLQLQTNPNVLIAYVDEELPEPYASQCAEPSQSISFAALLTRDRDHARSSVAFSREPNCSNDQDDVLHVASQLYQALQLGSGKVKMQTGTTEWGWHVSA